MTDHFIVSIDNIFIVNVAVVVDTGSVVMS